MRQADIFLETEGDNWFMRNHARLGKQDFVSDMIEEAGITPKSVLEIGCANGWRLAKLREKYNCAVLGCDPSRAACGVAASLQIPVFQTSASCIPCDPQCHDMVIYGFCLYLTDPSDWFTIVSEGDRALQTGGHIIIHDFSDGEEAYVRHYEHRDGILAYHVDFARFWLAHPLYELTLARNFGTEGVTILRKRPKPTIEVRR